MRTGLQPGHVVSEEHAGLSRCGGHTYTYVARATTPGTFVHPPAQAELMYEPSTNGRTSTGTLEVEEGASTAAR